MKFWFRIVKRSILLVVILMASISLVLFVFEDRIIAKVVRGANTYLKVPVQVQQIDLHFWRTFPRLTVAFNDVYISDPQHKPDTLIQAEQISLRFNPFDLLNGAYEIEQIAAFKGQINLRYDANGNLNCDLFKSNNQNNSAPLNLQLKDLFLEQFELSYRDAQTTQALFAKVQQTTLSGNFSAEKTTLLATGAWQLKQIKKGKVVFLRNQPLSFNFSLLVDQTKNIIKLPQARIELAHLPFLVDADFGPQTSSLDLQTADVSLLQLVKTLSPSNLKELRRMKAHGKVAFQLHYQTTASQPSPQINAYFGIQKGSLTEPQFGTKINAVHLYGTYKNLPVDQLQIDDFSFQSKGAHFSGQLQLQDFNQPRLNFQTKGSVPLALVNALYPIREIDKINGKADLEVKAALYQNNDNAWQTHSLSGKARIEATQLQISSLQKPFAALNCALQFDDAALQIQKCSAQIGQSSLEFQASFPDLLNSAQETTPIKMNGKLQASNIFLADFQSKSANSEPTWLLPQQLELHLPFQIEKFQDGNVALEAFSGTLNLSQKVLKFNNIQLKHAGGLWNGNVRITEDKPEKFDISTSGKVKHLDIRALFVQWQNFGQDVLLAEQIKGNGGLEFEVKAQYDLKSGLDENSLKARIDCRLENGRLLNAPVLQDLASSLTFGKGQAILGAKNQAALCKKLQDVHFETLENTFFISERKLKFAKMHIASTALDIDLVGQHSFDHDIDYAVGLRLRDLLIQETHTEFGEILDDGTGIRLFVRVSGNLAKPRVSWDKKGRKEAAQQRFEKSNQESKEMLKAAFGLYKNDPTVGVYKELTTPHETIQLHFNSPKAPSQTPVKEKEATTSDKNKKLQQKLEKWKLDQEKNQETEVNIRVVGSG